MTIYICATAPLCVSVVWMRLQEAETGSALVILTRLMWGLLVMWLGATFVPAVCVCVRRLHDAGISGWTILVGLLPVVGATLLVVFTLVPPTADVDHDG